MVCRVQDRALVPHVDRLAPETGPVVAGEPADGECAGEDRAEREQEQRRQHDRRRFVDMGLDLGRGAALAVEGHDDQPPGIEGRHDRRGDAHPEGEQPEAGMGTERRLENQVLGIEAGEAEHEGDADSGQRQRADPHQDVGRLHPAPEAAHAPHVLLVGHAVDDGAGTEEQQRLEEGMGHQVEHRHRIGADAGGEEHIAELRAGRIGDDPLDIVLHQADRRGEESGERADGDDDRQRQRRELEHRRQAAHHEHAGRHHGGGVDQGGDRRRAFHRVRQPGVQQDLGRLAHGADEQEDAGPVERGLAVDPEAADGGDLLARQALRRRQHGREIERTENREHGEHAERKSEIADPVDQEGLDGGGVGALALVPEADQQVGAQADAFPAEEHLGEILGRHQHQHGEGEQAEIGEEPRLVRIVAHIADGVDMDDGGDQCHHHDHDGGQRVETQRPIDAQFARRHPGVQPDRLRRAGLGEADLVQDDPAQDRRDDQQPGRDVHRGPVPDPPAEQPRDDGADQRQEDDGNIHAGLSLSSRSRLPPRSSRGCGSR